MCKTKILQLSVPDLIFCNNIETDLRSTIKFFSLYAFLFLGHNFLP